MTCANVTLTVTMGQVAVLVRYLRYTSTPSDARYSAGVR